MPSPSTESPWLTEKAKRESRHETKRNAILRAASLAFVEHGYHGTSMDHIAEMLHVTKPTIYKYFQNKHDLLDACHDKATSRALPAAKEAKSMKGTAFEKMRFYQGQTLEGDIDDFGRALTLIEDTGLDTESVRKFKKQRREIADIIEEIIRAGIDNGEISPGVDPKMAVLAWFGTFNFVARWYKADGPLTTDDIANQFSSFFFDGWKPR
jgi:AcrR family transcriptional regulator